MTLILELPDSKEAALKAKARAHGVSAEQYAAQLVERDLDQHADALAAADTHIAPAESGTGSLVEKMRALRARLKPDPEGWSTRDYVEYGRR
jgi:plasmid stability protein